jgi:type IV secretory pathway protease TraF
MIHSRLALIAIGTVALALGPAALSHSSFRLNRSASVPVGIYRAVPDRAPYAAICLPETVLAMAQKAGLAVPSGECPDGRQPILKSLYRATAQVPITFTPSGFVVGGRLLANSAPKLKPKTGVPLTALPVRHV